MGGARSRFGRRAERPPGDPYELALRLLGSRAHGEVELRRKLERRGCEPEAVRATLARLRELGYLDDAAFARALVAERAGRRGAALIGAELAARGLDRELAAAAIGELDRDRQVAAARRLLSRWEGLDRPRRAARLQRRGFAGDVVREALLDA